MEHRVLYTSDIHGNIAQFNTLFSYASKINSKTIIVGGDIAPKEEEISLSNPAYIEEQRRFLVDELPRLVRNFKKHSPQTNILLMMGNDDCAANLDVLENYPELFRNIHYKRFCLDDNYEIVGYSFVPITPFGIKDFEKFDLSFVQEKEREEYERRRLKYLLEGVHSTAKPIGWRHRIFSYSEEQKDSIQIDLKSPLFTRNPLNTLYVFHAPPNNTLLDILLSGEHAGSFAIREFIEKYQPRLTLHGHIHESVFMSGRFMDSIENTLSICSGNHNKGGFLALVDFDLYNPLYARRLILPV